MIDQLINRIKEKLTEYESGYIDITSAESVIKISNLLLNDIFIEPLDEIEYLYFGWFYRNIKRNYSLTIKYYSMAIEEGNVPAMYNIARYYESVEKDYDSMKKYYLMAIENGNTPSMYCLGRYYERVNDYNSMKMYYIMAIEKGDTDAMDGLGHYYEKANDYDSMEKYYLMSMSRFSKEHLEKHYTKTNNILSLLKFYSICDKDKLIVTLNDILKKPPKNNSDNYIQEVLNILATIDLSDTSYQIPTYMSILQKLIRNNINIIDLHFTYSLEGKGFLEAKNDFIANIAS